MHQGRDGQKSNKCTERELFIDNLLVRIHVIIVMIRWTGLAPWEFEFPFPFRVPQCQCERSLRRLQGLIEINKPRTPPGLQDRGTSFMRNGFDKKQVFLRGGGILNLCNSARPFFGKYFKKRKRKLFQNPGFL